MPLTSEMLFSVKNKLPLKLKHQFYLDTHGASQMSEMPE